MLLISSQVALVFMAHAQTDGSRTASYDRISTPDGAFPEWRALEVSIQAARNAGDTIALRDALLRSGLVEQQRGNVDVALERFYDLLMICERTGDEVGMAEVYNNIGSIHHYQQDFTKAKHYYTSSLEIQKRVGSLLEIGKLYNNFGTLAEDMGDMKEALGCHRRSLAIWQKLGNRSWQAVCFANMGSCYTDLGARDTARAYLKKSLDLLGRGTNGYLYGTVCTRMGDTYLADQDGNRALEWCRQALILSGEIASKPLEERACDCLAKGYAIVGRTADELLHYRRHIELRDSLYSNHRAREITRVELSHDFEKRQLADSLQVVRERLLTERVHAERLLGEERKRNVMLVSGGALLAAIVGLWSRLRYVRRSRTLISEQRDRADALLQNILPVRVAEELKSTGHVVAREFTQATVLFSDFEHFTSVAEQLSATELVEVIDTCFKGFDRILLEHRVEKIKTVGDAYLACAGVPGPEPGNPGEVIRAALAMQEFMHKFRAGRIALGLPVFAMRLGIHTGSVVGGIVGSHKFAFDIWGDAVNTAARMEECGSVGRVNISEATYQLVKDEPDLQFEARGPVEAKGKGLMHMYWVEHVVPQ